MERQIGRHWKRKYKVLKSQKKRPLMTVALSFAGDIILKWLK
jgi:hypothetical protein